MNPDCRVIHALCPICKRPMELKCHVSCLQFPEWVDKLAAITRCERCASHREVMLSTQKKESFRLI